MGLLRADLQALGNLPATKAGRRVLVGTLLGLGLLATMAWWLAQAIVEQPRLVRLIPHAGADSLHGLIGYGLMVCPLVATWLGLSLAQRQLFEAPELLLWRQAPLPGWRPALQVLVRACFLSCCWALALAGPFVMALLARSPAPAWAYALVPLAVAGATVPVLAVLLTVQIVLVRFFAGRVLRAVFAIVGALASVGFSAWLLMTMLAPGHERERSVAAAAQAARDLPWTVDQAAALLAAAARGEFDPHALLGLLVWLLLAVMLFRTAAHLHPRAHERHLAAEPPLFRRPGRRWPASVAATVRNKEFAQVLQQPGALIGFLVFAVLVFALAKNQLLVGGILGDERLPRDVAHVGVLMIQWFLAVLLVLYAHMGRLSLWDGAQWSLYMASPAAPRAILRGKLTAIFVFLLWPLLLVAVGGAQMLGAGAASLLTFTGIALGGTGAAVGVLAVVGTWPRLMRPDEAGQILHGGKNFFASMLLVFTFYVAIAPGALYAILLAEHARRLGPSSTVLHDLALQVVGAALLFGAVVASLGIWIGGRNFRHLLAPR